MDAELLPWQRPRRASRSRENCPAESCPAALLSRESLREGADRHRAVPRGQSLRFWLEQLRSSEPRRSVSSLLPLLKHTVHHLTVLTCAVWSP